MAIDWEETGYLIMQPYMSKAQFWYQHIKDDGTLPENPRRWIAELKQEAKSRERVLKENPNYKNNWTIPEGD